MSEKNADMLQARCIEFFQSNPSILSLRAKTQLDFLMNPNIPEFDMTNIKLASMVLSSSIKVFYMRDSDMLCDSYNDEASRCLQLFRDQEGVYHPLTTEARYGVLEFCRNVTENILDDVFDRFLEESALPSQNYNASKRYMSGKKDEVSNFSEVTKSQNTKTAKR